MPLWLAAIFYEIGKWFIKVAVRNSSDLEVTSIGFKRRAS